MSNNKNYNDLDGEVIEYHVAYGDGQLYGQPFDEDNFYPANGVVRKVGGNLRNTVSSALQNRQNRRNIKTQSKADARVIKAQSRLGKSNAKIEMAKSQGIAAQGFATSNNSNDLGAAMAMMPITPVPTGMSKNTKILIGVGVGVVVIGGIAAFFMLRNKK
jgi:hypothetical protein